MSYASGITFTLKWWKQRVIRWIISYLRVRIKRVYFLPPPPWPLSCQESISFSLTLRFTMSIESLSGSLWRCCSILISRGHLFVFSNCLFAPPCLLWCPSFEQFTFPAICSSRWLSFSKFIPNAVYRSDFEAGLGILLFSHPFCPSCHDFDSTFLVSFYPIPFYVPQTAPSHISIACFSNPTLLQILLFHPSSF